MIIKICGLKSLPDMVVAAQAGADMIGLNFYPPSPRFCTDETAEEICNAAPDGLCKVGLFVNETVERITAVAAACKLDAVQLHGDCPDGPIADLKVIRAFSISEEADLARLENVQADFLLLDAKVEGMHGGTGRSFDWRLAAKARDHTKAGIILAGGLKPDNVADAIRLARPDGVDVAGGVETSPGVKSAKLIEEFIRAARDAG
ncbi:MAG: phosphoribosylanthranilate isomerase [Planctomycetes bacterium]|nr:phosphoribosylanthranilate isomerase [Planctomycetota bacterium]